MTAPVQQLLGRVVHRAQFHNGVHLGVPPHARVEKAILHEKTSFPKPLGRRCADEMQVTPIGVYIRFGDEEKVVPWSNIYEVDLLPEQEYVLPEPKEMKVKK